MRVLFALVVAGVLSIVTSSAFAETGMISKKSAHSVSDTIDRLERILTEKGLTIFAKIDHSAGAKKPDWTCCRRHCSFSEIRNWVRR